MNKKSTLNNRCHLILIILLLTVMIAHHPVQRVRAACEDGKMFVTVRTTLDGKPAGQIWVWNAITSSLSQLGTTTYSIQFDAIARNPDNCNELYLISNKYNEQAEDRHRLYRLLINDPDNLENLGFSGFPPGDDNENPNVDRMTFGSDGLLYIAWGNNMYSLDPDTVVGANLGGITGWDNRDGGDITFRDSTSFWGVREGDLYLIEPDGGGWNATVQCSFSGIYEHTGVGVDSAGRLILTAWADATPTSTDLRTVTPTSCSTYPGTSPYPYSTGSRQITDATDIAGTIPTAVTMGYMAAIPQINSVRVEWSTGSELNVYGFNVYRADNPDGVRQKLNSDFIPSQAIGSVIGADYAYDDYSILLGRNYNYWIEVLQLEGPEWFDLGSAQGNFGVFLPLMLKK